MPGWDRQNSLTNKLPPLLEVATGQLTGYSLRRKYGRNFDVDTATVPEDVWNGGGLYTGQPASETPELVTVVSDDVADDSAGTGARTLELQGLDGDLVRQTETIILDGTTPVDSVKTWRRIPRAVVLTAGSTGMNQGQITVAHKVTTANVFVQMPALFNRTAICADTVPTGFTLYLVDWSPSSARGGGASSAVALQLLIRELGGLYEARDYVELSNAGSPTSRPIGLLLPAGTDWLIRIPEVTANDSSVSATVFGILIEDGTI